MSDENEKKEDKNEFDFLPPAELPPSFNQEKDHYHEEVAAEDFGMVEDFGLQMEYSDEDLLPENTAPSSLNIGFVGVGGGGNKMANAFIPVLKLMKKHVHYSKTDRPLHSDIKVISELIKSKQILNSIKNYDII